MRCRRTVVCLSLVIGLIISALAAQGASATTAFECVKTSNATSKFLDAHCLVEGVPGGGAEGYKHVGLSLFQDRELTITNASTKNATTEATPATLFVKNFLGTETEISCSTVSGTGKVKNEESGGAMKVAGSGEINFTKCAVLKPANKCKVKEPIVVKASSVSIDVAETSMSQKLSPSEGETFTKLKFEDKNAPSETCAATFKAEEFPVTGFVEGTANGEPLGKGATLLVTAAMSSIKVGPSVAVLSASVTDRLTNGNALAFTTP